MILDRLRSSTRIDHERAEHQITSRLFVPVLLPSHYLHVLYYLAAAYKQLETYVRYFPELAEIVEGRSKLHWLREDIRHMEGITPRLISPEYPVLSFGEKHPDLAVGIMYVMEGATLGGPHIARELSKNEWMIPDSVMHFFLNYREHRGEKWTEFRSFMSSYEKRAGFDAERVLYGAVTAFKLIEDSLSVE